MSYKLTVFLFAAAVTAGVLYIFLAPPRYRLISDVAWAGEPRTGVAESFVLDFNHDGRMDLLLAPLDPQAERPLDLFENTGEGFKDVTLEKLGHVGVQHARHLASGDFDGDGKMDFILADHGFDHPPFPGNHPHLLMARDGRLYDETAARLPRLAGFTFHVAALDADQDGDADIYLSNIPGSADPPLLLLNDGRGHFEKSELDLRHPANRVPLQMMTSVTADFNGDGQMDLYLGGQDLPKRQESQAQDFIFNFDHAQPVAWPAEALPPRWKDATWGTASVTPADFNRDGRLDAIAVVHDHGFKNAALQMLSHGADGRFTSALLPYRQEAGTQSFIPWAEVGDVNGDGWPDILFSVRDVSTQATRNRVHLLRGGPKFHFREVDAWLPQELRQGFGLVHFIDMDQDGRPEIVRIGHDRRISIYKVR